MMWLRCCVAMAAVVAAIQSSMAQFSWDADCGFNWADCCNYGSEENPEWHNNWTIAPNSMACPDLPGPEDDVYASTTVILAQPYQTYVKSLSVTGTFMLLSELDITNSLEINGTITEPTTFLFQNGPVATLELHGENATATISSFATLEFQFDGSISGPPASLLTNNGLIWKTGESPGQEPPYDYYSVLQMPVENNGTITSQVGTIMFDHDSTNNGVIEALGEGSVEFRGPANFELDGEVRGDGSVRFLSTFSGGAATITGNYHPISTLIAGGYATVNFEVETSIENLTIGNTGIVGGPADLTVDDLFWIGGYSTMAPGGTTIVQESALIQHDSFAGGWYAINRDMELHGDSVFDSAVVYIDDGELRNYGEVQLLGGANIVQACCTPDSLVQNFGTLRKVSGGQSSINVQFFNLGDVVVEFGTLEFGEMQNDAAITVNTGATLLMAPQQQINLDFGSITGPGTVTFVNDQHNPPVIDAIAGVYDVGNTTITGAQVEFQNDATTATLNLNYPLSKLLGDEDFVVTDQFNWSAGEMAGTGTTIVQGPMTLAFVGYWQSLSRTLELHVDAPVGQQPPTSTLSINPQGTLRCKDVTVDGNVSNSGLISPGVSTAPIAELHFTGGYTQTAGGQLAVNRLGPVHDQVIVDGVATLGGTLTASGFPAGGGGSYTILAAGGGIAGTFSALDVPDGMLVTYTGTSVILQSAPGNSCPADLFPSAPETGDGVVGAGDLAVLLASWGRCVACDADIAPSGAPDNVVGPADLAELLASWGACP